MAGGHDRNVESRGGAELRQPDAGRDAVDVQNVWTFALEPRVQTFGAPDWDAVVRFVPSHRRGNRIAIDRDAVVLVVFRGDAPRVGRRDPHDVARVGQAPAEPRDVDLGTADAVGEIPAEQVDDLHDSTGVPAFGLRLGGLR